MKKKLVLVVGGFIVQEVRSPPYLVFKDAGLNNLPIYEHEAFWVEEKYINGRETGEGKEEKNSRDIGGNMPTRSQTLRNDHLSNRRAIAIQPDKKKERRQKQIFHNMIQVETWVSFIQEFVLTDILRKKR